MNSKLTFSDKCNIDTISYEITIIATCFYDDIFFSKNGNKKSNNAF
jgi:hypothetical protein